MHARSINGDVVRSLKCLPTETELVPRLGEKADDFVDTLGYLPSTIFRIHSVYLAARKLPNQKDAEKAFIREMGRYKLSLLEAEMVWRHIAGSPQSEKPYRERCIMRPA